MCEVSSQRRPSMESKTNPETPGHSQTEGLSSLVFLAGVGLEVVVDIEVVQEALAVLDFEIFHLAQEPGEEVNIAVGGVVCVPDGASPV
jgi:hypothetical protein